MRINFTTIVIGLIIWSLFWDDGEFVAFVKDILGNETIVESAVEPAAKKSEGLY